MVLTLLVIINTTVFLFLSPSPETGGGPKRGGGSDQEIT